MTTTLLLLALVGLAMAALRFTPRERRRRVFRLEQFRPAAPLAGLLPTDRDAARAYSDLAAVHTRDTRVDDSAPRAVPGPVAANWPYSARMSRRTIV